MSKAIDLVGRGALVTGAGRRLGRAFAEALLGRGASVAVHHGRSSAGAQEVVERARQDGLTAAAVQADLASMDQVASLVDRAASALGEIDILVNSAAIFKPLGVTETSLFDWDQHMAINLTAPFLLSQAFARHRGGREGVIINMLDWRATRPGSDHFPYTITKAALAAMTRSLAQGLAPSIRVNGLALGAILPAADAEEKSEAALRGVPLGRWGTVKESAEALLFLIAGSDYITGEILHLDGGRQLT